MLQHLWLLFRHWSQLPHFQIRQSQPASQLKLLMHPLASSTIALAAAFVGLAAADCATTEYGNCGSNSTGVSCCPTNFYCQPWDVANYQCMPVPAKCPNQLINTSLEGNNLATFSNITTLEDCCDQCAATSGCVGYTFINDNPGNPVCYVKNAVTTSFFFSGAVSGMLGSASASLAGSAGSAVAASSSSADVDVANSSSWDSSDVSVDDTVSSGSDVDLGNSTSSDSSDAVAGEANFGDEGFWDALDVSMVDDESDDQVTED